jgi:plastocyanin
MGMRKLIAIIAIIVVTAVAWLVVGNKTNRPAPSSSTNSSQSQSTSNTSNQSSPKTVATDKVTIANFAFAPADITIKKGTTMTWTNQDSTSHTVTENDGKNGPNASPMNQDQTYSFTFNETGTFHYHCIIHPEMTGTVTVTE